MKTISRTWILWLAMALALLAGAALVQFTAQPQAAGVVRARVQAAMVDLAPRDPAGCPSCHPQTTDRVHVSPVSPSAPPPAPAVELAWNRLLTVPDVVPVAQSPVAAAPDMQASLDRELYDFGTHLLHALDSGVSSGDARYIPLAEEFLLLVEQSRAATTAADTLRATRSLDRLSVALFFIRTHPEPLPVRWQPETRPITELQPAVFVPLPTPAPAAILAVCVLLLVVSAAPPWLCLVCVDVVRDFSVIFAFHRRGPPEGAGVRSVFEGRWPSFGARSPFCFSTCFSSESCFEGEKEYCECHVSYW
ncbi:MAG: hypothetical protein GYB65_21300 [Chloroflexi bacterium]|nr:hypothetical protein [Chloroflexota bacterium]